MTYKAKSRSVEAVQVINYFLQMGGEMLLPHWAKPHCEISISGSFASNIQMIVNTDRGRVVAHEGTWIVKDGVSVSVLKDADFQRMYEEAK